MSVAQIKLDINQYLEQIDEDFLKAVHSMLNTYVQQKKEHNKADDTILAYDVNGNPKYTSQMQAIYDKEVKAAVENKEYTTLEDLEKEVEKW